MTAKRKCGSNSRPCSLGRCWLSRVQLAASALLMSAVGSVACGESNAESPPDAPPVSVDSRRVISDARTHGSVDLSWNLLSGDGGGCGLATTVRATSRGTMGTDYRDLYDCSLKSGSTAPLPVDGYLVWLDFVDSTGNLVAQSFSQMASVDREGVPVGFDVTMDGGFIQLAWIVTPNCAATGAAYVNVQATPVGGGTPLDDLFTCSSLAGVTNAVPVGAHDVTVSLRGSSGVLEELTPERVTIEWGNQLVDLGTKSFTP